MSNETPTTPVMEQHAGTVLPGGRGMELHGVPLYGTPDLVDETDRGEDVVVEPLPEPPAPIPVVVVHDGARELRRFRTQRAYAGDPVSQVVGRDQTRTSVRIRNLSVTAADRAWLSEDEHTANAVYGYPLDPGAEITLHTENEIYVSRDGASPTNPIPLAVLVEYAVTEH